MTQADPLHPGFIVRHQFLVPCGLELVDGARVIGVRGQALSNIVTARGGISPDKMNVRLGTAFGGNDESWLQLQLACHFARVAKRAHTINVTSVAVFRRDRAALQLKPL